MADRLPSELLSVVGFKLDSIPDRIRFRAVSKSWRSALPSGQLLLMLSEEPEPVPFFPEPSWLMVLDPEFSIEEEVEVIPAEPRGFVSLGEQTICNIDFPDIHRARVVGSTGNWLITMHLDKTMRMSNPFTGLQFHLPSFTTFRYGGLSRPYEGHGEVFNPTDLPLEDYRDTLVRKVVLSSAPRNGSDRDCVAVALHFAWNILAMARPGDASWTTIQIADSPMTHLGVEDMIFYKNQLYAITELGRLMVCDIGDGLKPPQVSFLSDCFYAEKDYEAMNYLVEWAGELLMVSKYLDDFDEMPMYRTGTFEVYKFDFVNNKFSELSSLGVYSLFLGFNTSVSVLASDYFGLVKRNCIYYTDDYAFGYVGNEIAGGHDMGVFDLEDGSITPHFEGTSTSLYSPPVWIVQPQQ